MVRQEVLDFIRKYKGEFTDEQIRQRLLEDGIPLHEIDDALDITSALSVPAQGPAAPKQTGFWPFLFVGAALLTVVLLAVLRKSSHIGGPKVSQESCSLGAEAKKEVAAEVAKHSPELYAHPFHVDSFLPGEPEGGDAGPYLLAAVKTALEAGGPELAAGLATPGYKIPVEIRARALGYLEGALRYSDSEITGTYLIPRTYAEVGSIGMVPVILALLEDTFFERYQEAMAQGELLEAEGEAKKSVALGLLMMKDWSSASQALGAGVLMDGFAAVQKVHAKLVDLERGLDCELRKMEIAKVGGMLAKDVKSYVPQPEETKKIAASLKDPESMDGLVKYLDSFTLRSRYAEFILLGVIEAWSPEEIRSGRPRPIRQRVLAYAREHKDVRLSRLGAGYTRVFLELEKVYAGLSPEDRELVISGKPPSQGALPMPSTPEARRELLVDMVSRDLPKETRVEE